MQEAMSTEGGDYVLPVGMTDLQKKVTSAVVSSNFSEILSFFDSNEQSRTKYEPKLKRMLVDLNLVATHPYLLLTHLQPSLAGKRTPAAIETMSGKFQSLVLLAKKFNRADQNVAVVCEAGHTTDLVESVLCDRGLNTYRYSATTPSTKLYKREVQKRKGAMFHLVPSSRKDLREAVYAAFDIMILMDNQFNINSDFGRGFRAQLRDPNQRKPFASVIRLVALNSAQHCALILGLSFSEQIAAAVVLRKNVGAMSSSIKQAYSRDLSVLSPFVQDPDGPFPLEPLPSVKRVGQKEVEQVLYLDDEDQYQVDFANKRIGGARRRLLGAMMAPAESASSDEESNEMEGNEQGEDVKMELKPEFKQEIKLEIEERERKRRRIDFEDRTVRLCEELSVQQPFSARLLVELNDSLAKNRRDECEINSHRRLGTSLEQLLELQREHMVKLARRVLDLEKEKALADRRVEKFRTRNERLEQDLQNTEKWWYELGNGLKSARSDDDRVEKMTKRLTELEGTAADLRKSLDGEKSRCTRLEEMEKKSSEFMADLTAERDALKEQINELTARVEDEPRAREGAVAAQLKRRTIEVEALRNELVNIRESVKVQLSREKNGSGDRRFGRGGRQASRQSSPHIST